MQFKEVTGQTPIKRALVQSLQQRRMPHAQLFLGGPGTGQLALALAYAQYAVCAQPGDTDACGQCAPCRKAAGMVHPDIHYTYPVVRKDKGSKKGPPRSADWAKEWRTFIGETPYREVYDWLQFIAAEEKQGNITAAECQEVIKKLNLKTYEAPYKILILWMPEYLGKEGNILLKLLEEPPDNTLLLLAAENEDMLLNTIISRTQIVRLPPVPDADITEALTARFELEPETAIKSARLANGNVTEAFRLATREDTGPQELQRLMKLFDVKDGDTPYEVRLRALLNTCFRNRGLEGAKWAEDMARLGRESQKHFFGYVLHILQAALNAKYNHEAGVRVEGSELEMVRKLGQKVSLSQLEATIKLVNDTTYYIERNANAKLNFTAFTLKLGRVLRAKVRK